MERAKVLHPQVALTKNMELTRGAHILYTYSDWEKYIENVVSFLSTGIKLKQGSVLIESLAVYETVHAHLAAKGFTQTELDTIIFRENEEFYRSEQTFDMAAVLFTLQGLLKPYTDQDLPVRIWSKVRWKGNINSIIEELSAYEIEADKALEKIRAFTICVYNGKEIPANAHMEMMKSHAYVMTDIELMQSLFYRKSNLAPSLLMEERLEEKIHYLNEEFQLINSYYKNLIEELPDAVLITSNHEVIYGNRAAAQLFESEESVFPRGLIWDFFQPSCHELMMNRYNRLKRGEKLPLAELKAKTFKGKLFDVEMISFPFVFDHLHKYTTISILRSIKERKEHEQLTIKTEKLSIAGQLAASIAHEVRNPLTSIKGFLQLSKEGIMEPDHYNIIEDEIDRIETIASELLILGKPLSVEIETCDASKMLRDTCIFLQSQAVMKKVEILYENTSKSCLIRCNQGQIKQVFLNIIKNAIEAMSDGGVIRTGIRTCEGFVVITIEDEGKGMPDSVLKKLGEPFYSTKDEGTGLGLMVCFNIVEQHNGSIHVHSEIGKGTVFTISLPDAGFGQNKKN